MHMHSLGERLGTLDGWQAWGNDQCCLFGQVGASEKYPMCGGVDSNCVLCKLCQTQVLVQATA